MHACRVTLCPFMLGWLPQVQSSSPCWQGINCFVLCKGCEFFWMKWNMHISHFFHSVSQCAARKIIYTLEAEWTASAWMLRALFCLTFIFLLLTNLTILSSLQNSPQHFFFFKYEGFCKHTLFPPSECGVCVFPEFAGFIYFPYSSPWPLASPLAISSVYEPPDLSVHNDSCIQRL